MKERKGGGGIGWLLLLSLAGLWGFLPGATASLRRLSGGSQSSSGHRELLHHQMEDLKSSFLAGPQTSLSSSSTRGYHVTDYGADPTGTNDSTQSIMKAISDAFQSSSGRTLIQGVTDLGGAEVHLGGGAYLISSPVTLPATGGNLKISGGSLHASDGFPAGRYLIELWASPNPKVGSKSSNTGNNSAEMSSSPSDYEYEYITLSNLLLDSNYQGGGIAVVNSLRTTIDNCYITHFTSDGIWVKGGHETYIRNSYLGQHITAGGDTGERNFSGTGINLASNDNAVTDVVIFSATIGVLISGQANTLSGVHCYNKATGFGGTGIYLKLPGLTQTRIVNCYLDYTGIVSEDPVQLHISSSFFLGGANVVLKSVNGVVRGVNIVDNMFSGYGSNGGDIVQLDQSAGPFTSIDQVIVDRNNAVDGMELRSTAAKGSAQGNGTEWTVDFSPVLLFPNRIDHVQYTMMAESAFPSHALRNITQNRITIESDMAVSATIYVLVDQLA